MKYSLSILLLCGYLTVRAQPNDPQNKNKTKDEVDAQIKQAGGTYPDWWDSVELKYHERLDINWPVQQGIWEGRGGRGERGQPGGGERGRRGDGPSFTGAGHEGRLEVGFAPLRSRTKEVER